MNARALILMALLAMLAGLGAGCKSAEQRAREDRDRRDIRALLLNVRQAIISGDRDAWLAYLHGSTMERRFALELFNLWQTSFLFQDAFIASYGPQAWRDLQDHRPTRVSIPPTSREYWEEIGIRLKGDRARCENWYQIHMWWLDRLPEGWRIRAGDLLNQRAENLTTDLITDHILATRSTRAVTRGMLTQLRRDPPSHDRFVQLWEAARKSAITQRRELGSFDANAPLPPNGETTQPSEPSKG